MGDPHESEADFIFPVQFINCPVIPLRITDKQGRKILYLAVRENFEEETLKRLLGLAQALTSGWCSKIILGFSDYQEIKHSSIKETIFLNFNQPEFTDMVEIKCYQDTFKSFEKVGAYTFPLATVGELNFANLPRASVAFISLLHISPVETSAAL